MVSPIWVTPWASLQPISRLLSRTLAQEHARGVCGNCHSVPGTPVLENKIVVFSVLGPRSPLDFVEFYKLPVRHIRGVEPQIVTNRGRDVEAGSAVEVVGRAVFSKDVLPMVRPKGAAISPLGVTNAPAGVAYGHPAVTAHAHAVSHEGGAEPRNDDPGFRFVGRSLHVVLGEGNVEGVEFWGESGRQVAASL